jgi:nucleoside-diphosphate-sugar epimerase
VRIVVTGAAGFIASALLNRFAPVRGVEVVAVSRFPLAHGFVGTSVVADLSARGWTSALPDSADIVVHLAQSGRYKEFPQGGPDMIAVNVDSTAELLDWSRRHGVRRFILASSGSVYEPSDSAHKESDRCRATDMYTATKLAAEQIAQCYDSLFGVTVTRIFSVYGPGQKHGLFRTLINRARSGEPISVAAKRGPLLTPLFIEDAVEILAQLATRDNGPATSVLNLAGRQRIDLRAVAEIIGRVGGWTPHYQDAQGKPSSLVGDISLLTSILEGSPATDIEAGIRRMIEEERPARDAQGSTVSIIRERA